MFVDCAMLSAAIAIPPFLIRVNSNEATNSHDSSKTILLEMRKHDKFDNLCRKPTCSLPDVFNLTIARRSPLFTLTEKEKIRSMQDVSLCSTKESVSLQNKQTTKRNSLFDIYILPLSFPMSSPHILILPVALVIPSHTTVSPTTGTYW